MSSVVWCRYHLGFSCLILIISINNNCLLLLIKQSFIVSNQCLKIGFVCGVVAFLVEFIKYYLLLWSRYHLNEATNYYSSSILCYTFIYQTILKYINSCRNFATSFLFIYLPIRMEVSVIIR